MRTGDYRLQFRIRGDTVIVDKVGHRGGFYEDRNMIRPIVEIEGKRYVLVEEKELRRLENSSSRKPRKRAGELPSWPEADEEGNRSALEYIQVSIARDIIRERKALGLTQERLAELAGIRQETLSRIESAKHSPTVRTVEKIDRALKREAARESNKKVNGRKGR